MRLKNVLFCSALGLIALTSCKTVDEGINESELNEDRRDTVPAGSSYFPLPSGTEAVYAIKDMKMDVNTNGGETRAFITFSMKHCTDILGPVHTSVDFNSKGDKANLYVSATGIRTSQAKTARCASSGVQTSEVFVTKRKIDSKNVKLIPVVKSATVEKGTSMADIAKADGLVPTKASAAGLVASLGTVRDASITFPKNKSGSPIVSIALDYVIGCNSGFGPVTYQEDVVDPANDDPNVHVYLSAIEIIDSNKATCIVAASPVVSISAAAKAFKATDKFTADDVYLHGMRLVKPLKAILPRGLAPAAASVSTQTAPADEDEMNDDVGGERRVTCMAFWSGAEFNPKTKKCEQRGRSGCSNPFKFKSVAECNAANKINQKPEGGMTCMAYWEGYNFNPSLNACEFGHASGCSNPFTYPNLRACLAKHKGADKPNDGVTCMAFWTGYVRDEASSKCVRAEGSGCKNPFTFKTAKECRAAKRS